MSFSKAHFLDILQVALPGSLAPILTIATVLLLTAFVGKFGEAALAGYGIGSRIEFLIIPLVFGLGSSMTSLVGMGIGAGNIVRAEKVGRVGGLAAGLVAGIVGLLLSIFPDGWIALFTQDPDVQNSAKSFIQIAGPCFFFQGLGLSLYFASQGANSMFWPTLSIILKFAVTAAVAFGLGFALDLGLDGIYYGAAVGMVIYAIIIAVAIHFGAWRKPQN
jgi:Na+-driven multidrug efflux pump